ncbi:MAG: DNA repair protein RecO [Dehalococcoidia bacterium]
MAPPRTYRTEALTLKKVPLGEADLMVTLYTRESGKVRAVAKGARRSTSKLVGHLEPLTLTRLSLARGRNLDIITQAQIIENFTLLKSDLTGVTKGLYVAELVEGFGSEAHSNESLYQLTLDTLEVLGQDPAAELPLLFFQLHLLDASGLRPELDRCAECRTPLEPEQHRFSPNGGGTFCLGCTPADASLRPLSLRALKVLRLLRRSHVANLPHLPMDPPLLQELQSILTNTVQYWLDKEIRSNSFLEHLQHWSKTEVKS